MYLENLKKERKLSVKSDVNFQSFWVFLAIVLIWHSSKQCIR